MHSASPYLIPFVLEYSMIAVGIISSFLYSGAISSNSMTVKANRNLIKVFSMSQKIIDRYLNSSEASSKVASNHESNQTKLEFDALNDIIKLESRKMSGMGIEQGSTDHSKNFNRHQSLQSSGPHEFNSLQKSHAGLFAGMVLLCITVVTCVIFLFSQLQHNRARAEIIYFSTDITIHTLLMIACVSAFIKTKNLGFAPKSISTDDMLLLIAAFGSFTFELTNASALLTAIRASTSSAPEDSFFTTPLSLLGRK